VCNHSFSADSIKGYCAIPNKLYKCPAAGCNKSFKLSDCASDDALANKVRKYQRRVAANEQDSDAEEVVSD
jgi:SUMO ligase MMS21 Smc5/6 complex component